MTRFSLEGKIAIVTGASRGIGFSIANGLAEAGAQVVGTARTKKLVHQHVSTVDYIDCDVENYYDFNDLCAKIIAKYKKIDILVNAAGVSLSKSSGMSEIDIFEYTLRVNLRAPFNCMQNVFFYMKNQGGSIINITSLGSILGMPDNPGYVASKGGLRALTKSLALDWGRYNIRVNNILPGYIRTALTEKSYQDKDLHEARLRRMMLNRWGQPDDLVGAAIFLASEASSYVTGVDIIVDGGWSSKGLDK